MGSRNIKQVILSLHNKSKSLEKLDYSPSYVECNSEVRLRLGLKNAPKLPLIGSKVGRDLMQLKVRSKSVDCYTKTTKKRISGNGNDINKTEKQFRSYLAAKPIRNRLRRSIIFISFGLIAFVALLTLRDSNDTNINPSCNCNWTIDVERLDSELRNKIFGQEVAINVLINTLKFHPCDVDRQYVGPLILFLHGWSGSGKTLTARILADRYGRSGANVYWYIPTTSEETKDFEKWFNQRTSDCSFDVYILDDFDSIVSSVFESLQMMSNERNVFVVTSNKGEKIIADRLLNVLLRGGFRNDITIEDLVSNDSSVYFPYSELSNLVYVPFLPLERQHLIKCISKVISSHSSSVSNSTLYSILNRTKFIPDNFPVFSKTGCKKLQLV